MKEISIKGTARTEFGKKAAPVYAVIALIFIFLGTLMSNTLVWELTDMFNNLMVIPNAIALFALTGMVVQIVRSRDLRQAAKK